MTVVAVRISAAEFTLNHGKADVYDDRAGVRGTLATSLPVSFAAKAAPRARFVVSSAGETLDTARITIPSGKFGYLLENPSKAGVFAKSLARIFHGSPAGRGLRAAGRVGY